MSEIIFEVREDEADGGYTATALGYGIHTQGETLEELRAMVAPFFGPMPVSTTSVAWLPTMIAMLGKPMIAQTRSETFVVVSPSTG